jgi:hypothetical protein
MPQNRPPGPTTRPVPPRPAPARVDPGDKPQPSPAEYTLPGLDPPADWEPPQIRRGGFAPIKPELRKHSKAAETGVSHAIPLKTSQEAIEGPEAHRVEPGRNLATGTWLAETAARRVEPAPW